ARGFAGIALAHAAWSGDGGRRGVVLTVAGTDGAGVADTARLAAAAAAAGDPHVPLRVRSYRRRAFRVAATLYAEPDRAPAAVLRDAEAALRARFGFGAVGFGERVSLSAVTAALQGAPGVAWVDVDLLYREGEPATLRDWLPADVPLPGQDAAASPAAELLVVDLRPGDLRVAP
ncbi:MAG TPA: hypothetical protein VFQ45_03850, partial [Longimicrobium sp.]|nr:hypothetical protein [Longimicrobium sp.]